MTGDGAVAEAERAELEALRKCYDRRDFAAIDAGVDKAQAAVAVAKHVARRAAKFNALLPTKLQLREAGLNVRNGNALLLDQEGMAGSGAYWLRFIASLRHGGKLGPTLEWGDHTKMIEDMADELEARSGK